LAARTVETSVARLASSMAGQWGEMRAGQMAASMAASSASRMDQLRAGCWECRWAAKLVDLTGLRWVAQRAGQKVELSDEQTARH